MSKPAKKMTKAAKKAPPKKAAPAKKMPAKPAPKKPTPPKAGAAVAPKVTAVIPAAAAPILTPKFPKVKPLDQLKPGDKLGEDRYFVGEINDVNVDVAIRTYLIDGCELVKMGKSDKPDWVYVHFTFKGDEDAKAGNYYRALRIHIPKGLTFGVIDAIEDPAFDTAAEKHFSKKFGGVKKINPPATVLEAITRSPAWIAAKQGAMEEGLDEAAAEAAANDVVA